jgi:hypothetical protein
MIFNFTTAIHTSDIIEEKEKLYLLQKIKERKKKNKKNILFILFILFFIILFIFFLYYNYNYYYFFFHIKNVSNINKATNINFYFPYQRYITISFYYKRYLKTNNKCYNFLNSHNLTRPLFICFRSKRYKAY